MELRQVEVKENDVLEFLAISWDIPFWEFDHPTVILEPIIRLSPNGDDCEGFIEEVASDLSVEGSAEDEDEDQEDFFGVKLSTLKKICKNRLAGKDDWKTKIREVVWQKIQFVKDEDGELMPVVIETKKA